MRPGPNLFCHKGSGAGLGRDLSIQCFLLGAGRLQAVTVIASRTQALGPGYRLAGEGGGRACADQTGSALRREGLFHDGVEGPQWHSEVVLSLLGLSLPLCKTGSLACPGGSL